MAVVCEHNVVFECHSEMPLDSPRCRKRLLEEERYGKEDDAEGGEGPEYAVPSAGPVDEAADHRRARGCEAVDGSHQGHDLGEGASPVEVGRDGAGQEVASRGAEPLHEAPEDEDMDGRRPNAADCPYAEHDQGDDEYWLAPEAVAERTEHHLANAETYHAECEPELHRGARGVEICHHLGKRRQVEVVDE